MRGDLAIHGGLCVTPAEEIPDSLVVCREGRILWVGPQSEGEIPEGATRLDAAGRIVCPGFIDNHVHGGDGADITLDGVEGVRHTARHLLRYGTTAFLPTTVSARHDVLVAAIEGCHEASEADSRPQAEILGIHVEGPYINRKKKGAQPAEAIRDPDPEEFRELLEAAQGLLRVMTVAPEIPGALDLVKELVSHGIVASLGHSEATYDQTLAAMEVGATQATHLFNAMDPIHHRRPSLLLAALLEPGLRAEVIADGVHLDPHCVKLAVRQKGPEGVLLITDGMAAVGRPDGIYTLGDNRVTVRGDLCTLDDGTIASSMLTMNRAVRNAMAFAGVSLVDAVRMASLVPARAAGADDRKGSLEPGKDADLALLNPDFSVAQTVMAGEVVWSS